MAWRISPAIYSQMRGCKKTTKLGVRVRRKINGKKRKKFNSDATLRAWETQRVFELLSLSSSRCHSR